VPAIFPARQPLRVSIPKKHKGLNVLSFTFEYCNKAAYRPTPNATMGASTSFLASPASRPMAQLCGRMRSLAMPEMSIYYISGCKSQYRYLKARTCYNTTQETQGAKRLIFYIRVLLQSRLPSSPQRDYGVVHLFPRFSRLSPSRAALLRSDAVPRDAGNLYILYIFEYKSQYRYLNARRNLKLIERMNRKLPCAACASTRLLILNLD
jgi:hypothetical protein